VPIEVLHRRRHLPIIVRPQIRLAADKEEIAPLAISSEVFGSHRLYLF
jgi:hypothetical protein